MTERTPFNVIDKLPSKKTIFAVAGMSLLASGIFGVSQEMAQAAEVEHQGLSKVLKEAKDAGAIGSDLFQAAAILKRDGSYMIESVVRSVEVHYMSEEAREKQCKTSDTYSYTYHMSTPQGDMGGGVNGSCNETLASAVTDVILSDYEDVRAEITGDYRY